MKRATAIFMAATLGWATSGAATIINGGFESGDASPWVFKQKSAGHVVEAGLFTGGIATSSGQYMGYLSTLNGEFERNHLSADIDRNGTFEDESAQLEITLTLENDATVLVDLDFLVGNPYDNFDLFGVARGAVIDGVFEVLKTHEKLKTYTGSADLIMESDILPDSAFSYGSSGFTGHTGFQTFAIPLSAGEQTLTFFVADSKTDGGASGLFIDNLRLAPSIAPVPEPGTASLLVVGLVTLGIAGRRKQRCL